MSGQQDPHNKKEKEDELLHERLQHDENAWAASEQAFNEQFAQLFRYVLRLEKRTTNLESANRSLRERVKKLEGSNYDKRPEA